jgi:hypothetical protein
MSNIGKPERATQNRVIALFREELGYRYLGDWLNKNGYSTPQINRVLDAEIAVLEGKLSKARQVKQGMMSVLLTGRVRLV